MAEKRQFLNLSLLVPFNRPSVWATYEKLLRADFTIFDQHPVEAVGQEVSSLAPNVDRRPKWTPSAFFTLQPPAPGAEPLRGIPVVAFYAQYDRRVSKDMVQGWQQLTDQPLTVEELPGHHLFVFDPSHKEQWLRRVLHHLDIPSS